MINGYDSNLTTTASFANNTIQKDTNLPTGSRLAQYLQGSTLQNFASNTNSVQQFSAGSNLIGNNSVSLTYSLSQLNVADNSNHDIIEDGVSAFLNGNYANLPQDYYQSSEDYQDEDGPMYYAYQNQPARIWRNRIKGQPSSNFFIDPNLKAELIARQLSLQSSSTDGSYPSTIENFHNVTLLSNSSNIDRNSSEMVYRAVKSTDGHTYCLRRVPTLRFYNQKQLIVCENWKRLSHSNVVQLREVFQTRAFNDNSYVFVYDFYPMAETLKSHFFGHKAHDQSAMLSKHVVGQKFGGLSELLIWNYIIQISSAIRCIHSSGLSIRLFDISRVLLCGKSRILIGCCGIADILQNDLVSKSNTVAQQVDDLRCFGQILLILVVGRLNAAHPDNIAISMKYIDQHCSMDLKNVIQTMLGAKINGHKLTSINEIMPMIGARFYGHIENLQIKTDYLEDELSKEVENGRLFRILCKLNTVNERLDPNLDVMWSETSDRYFLKLFRDYVFHQVNGNGKAWIDLSHITMCLNKLDAGVDESIQLISRDGDNVLIVTYAELRKFLENSFNFLTSPQYLMSQLGATANTNVAKDLINNVELVQPKNALIIGSGVKSHNGNNSEKNTN